MKDKTKRTMDGLCEQAAVEQNHEKLFQSSEEINRLLPGKETQLANLRNEKDNFKPS